MSRCHIAFESMSRFGLRRRHGRGPAGAPRLRFPGRGAPAALARGVPGHDPGGADDACDGHLAGPAWDARLGASGPEGHRSKHRSCYMPFRLFAALVSAKGLEFYFNATHRHVQTNTSLFNFAASASFVGRHASFRRRAWTPSS